MKITKIFRSIFICLSLIVLTMHYEPIDAQDFSSCSTQFDRRSIELGNYSYYWTVKTNFVNRGVSDEVMNKALIGAKTRAEEKIAKDHVTKDEVKKKYLEDEQKLTKLIWQATTSSSTSSLVFNRFGKNVYVDVQDIDPLSHAKSRSHMYFDADFALFYGDNSKLENGQTVRSEIPLILGAKGNAIYQHLGIGTFYTLLPFHFVILANANPFDVYDSKWDTFNASSDKLTIKHDYNYTTGIEADSLTLDTRYFVPVSCEITNKNNPNSYLTRFVVKHTRKFLNHYIPDIVEYKYSVGNIEFNGIWILDKIAPSKSISLKDVPKNMMISDTRLKGENLTHAEVADAL